MTECDQKKYKFNLSVATVIISIVAPLLYSFGYMYERGYLYEFGLSGEIFTNSFQGYLFVLFFLFAKVVLGIFSISSKYLWWLLAYALIVPITAFVMTYEPILNLKNKLIKSTKKKVNESSSVFIFATTGLAYFWFIRTIFIVIFVSFTLVLGGIAPFQMGQEIARNQIKNFNACDIEVEPKINNCVFIYKGEIEVLSGLLIEKSDTHIGIWDGEKSIVYPLKDEIAIFKKAKEKAPKEK